MKPRMLNTEKRGMIESNIYAAVAEANEHVKRNCHHLNTDQRNTAWNVAYHEAMDRMCKLDGVRV